MNRGWRNGCLLLIALALVCIAAGFAQAQTRQGILFGAKVGSGFTNDDLANKSYVFRMLEASNAPLDYGVRAVVGYGTINFDASDNYTISGSWKSSSDSAGCRGCAGPCRARAASSPLAGW